jgi:flagellar assembly factor FliW
MSAPAAAPTSPISSARLEFVTPILGFETETEFELASLEPNGLVWSLQSTQSPELRFIAVPPGPFFPDYQPVIEEDALNGIAAEADELAMLVLLTVSGSIHDATANLMAPIVIASGQGRAAQVVLNDDRLPLHAPLGGAR